MTPEIRIQSADFETATEIDRLEKSGGGGISTFTGIVRSDGDIAALELEHYPAMTEAALGTIAREAASRWSLSALTVIHRHGRLQPGERIVFVGSAAAHRGEAISAMNFVIDWLKTDAPFWKREDFADGSVRWVEARSTDEAARDRWQS